MKLRRFVTSRLASALLLACALLALTPPAGAEEPPKTVALNDDVVDKFIKANDVVKADSEAKAEADLCSKDEEVQKASTIAKMSEIVLRKYPKLAAAYEKADTNPGEMMEVFLAIFGAGMAEATGADPSSITDPVEKANLAYYKANKAKLEPLLSNSSH